MYIIIIGLALLQDYNWIMYNVDKHELVSFWHQMYAIFLSECSRDKMVLTFFYVNFKLSVTTDTTVCAWCIKTW